MKNNAKPNASYSPPPKETPATARDIINVKASLAALLAEESNFMDTMQIGKVGELQDRKLKLTGLLERYTRYLTNHPEALAHIAVEEKAELKKITDNFHVTMRKNYDTLLIARAVNGAIVKCVTQSVAKKDVNPIYNARGAIGRDSQRPVAITLNQTI